jgi:hypothetical protein
MSIIDVSLFFKLWVQVIFGLEYRKIRELDLILNSNVLDTDSFSSRVSYERKGSF